LRRILLAMTEATEPRPVSASEPAPAGDWHPADIAAALKKRGHSLASLSLEHGYHETAAGKALKKPWSAIERVIADAIGVSPQVIWPSRYSDDGTPLRRRR
jgi:Ner family transcriptional regulator